MFYNERKKTHLVLPMQMTEVGKMACCQDYNWVRKELESLVQCLNSIFFVRIACKNEKL